MKNIFVKSIFLLLISFMFILGCSKENSKEFPYIKSDLEKMKLKGKVKTYREYSYKTKSSFGKVSKGERQYEEGFEDSDFYTFNTNGYMIERIGYDIKGGIKEKNTYNYDERGNIIESKRFEYVEKSNYLGFYKYSDKGFLNERTIYNNDGSISSKTIYDYRKETNEIVSSLYFSESELYSTDTNKYDNKGNLIESNGISYSKNGFSNTTFYLYDEQGNLIKQNISTTLNEDGRTSEIISNYNYNKYGDKIEHWFNDSTQSKTTYEYEYDSQNNWIKRIEYYRGFPEFILERKIEYYN